MALRFRKSVRLAPGLRMNIGRRGVGISAGIPGARVSANSRGQRSASVGAPGTGFSWRRLFGRRRG